MFPESTDIISEWQLVMPKSWTEADLEEALALRINQLIREDLHALIILLYRIDVDENKLKAMLQSHPDVEAGRIVAAMVIDRLKQKKKTREMFKPRVDELDEEERW
jgi:hypothetical protein